MVVDTTKESVCVNQIVGQKKEDIVVEGDVIVPDIKPDILNTISTSGNVCIYKKEVLEGKIRIDGCTNIYVIYLADNEGGTVRGINTSLDFTKIIDLENSRPGMNVNEKIHVKSIDARVLNGRKMNIKVTLGTDMKVYSNENVEVIKDINGVGNIQKLSSNIDANSLVGEGSTKVYAKDNIPVDEIDNLAEILKTDMKIINKDIKTSYNKILAKADLDVNILYLTEDGRINSCSNQIPVMGFVDIPNVAENNTCDTQYELKNVILKPSMENEHSVYVEAEIEISISAFEKKVLNLIEDLYSPTETVKFSKKEIDTMSDKSSIKNTCSIKESIQDSEIMQGKIHDASIQVDLNSTKVLNDKILYEGELKVNLIYDSNNMGLLDVKPMNLPFTYSLDFPNVNHDSFIDTNIDIVKKNFVIMPSGQIDASVDLEFNVNATCFRKVNVINEIELEETRDKEIYSMVIYFVKSGDTLWNIAKRLNSTVEDIARVNNIDMPDILQVGRQLFVPKYNSKRSA